MASGSKFILRPRVTDSTESVNTSSTPQTEPEIPTSSAESANISSSAADQSVSSKLTLQEKMMRRAALSLNNATDPDLKAEDEEEAGIVLGDGEIDLEASYDFDVSQATDFEVVTRCPSDFEPQPTALHSQHEISRIDVTRPQSITVGAQPLRDDSKRTKNMKAFRKCFLVGPKFLTTLALRHNIRNTGVFDPSHENVLHGIFYDIVVSTHTLLMKSLVYGNLAEDKLTNPSLLTELKRMENLVSSRGYPGIYHQQLTNDRGESPTPAELLQAINLAEQYAQLKGKSMTPAQVRKIDMWVDTTHSTNIMPGIPFWKQNSNGRRYLTQPKDTSRWVTGRATNLETFCDALRERIGDLDIRLHSVPLEGPLCEIGWSINLEKRMASHAKHVQSNFIMNLFEAICGILFPGRFRIRQNIIYLCWQPTQPGPAEVFFTRVCQGYIDTGTGFSHANAGNNNESGTSLPQDHWDHINIHALQDPALHARRAAYRLQGAESSAKIEYVLVTRKIIALFKALKDKKDDEEDVAQLKQLMVVQNDLESRFNRLEQSRKRIEDGFAKLDEIKRKYQEYEDDAKAFLADLNSRMALLAETSGA